MTKTNVFDVASYILNKQGSMSAMKLQKLVYYSQAWSLVWDEMPLFDNKIEAWANGPVVRDLYDAHKGLFQVCEDSFAKFKTNDLNLEQEKTIDAVLDAYGSKSAQWLSDQTHSEDPWKFAREGLSDSERGAKEITHEVMMDYYRSL